MALRPDVTLSIAPGAPQPVLASDPELARVLTATPPNAVAPLFAGREARLPEALRNIVRLRFDDDAARKRALGDLATLEAVRYAEPNHAYRTFADPNDPDLDRQWYLETIRAREAWALTLGDPSIVVGVIDTGVDYLHEDLAGQLWINPAEDINGNGRLDDGDRNGIDDDGNGYVDDVIGWDFTDAPAFPDQGDFRDPDNDPMDEFSAGHGTAASGIIAAARDNGAGISGIAPGVRVMALRAGTASGFLEEDDVAEAILYAIDNGCRIVNMSFGDLAFSYLLRDAIRWGVQQGVIFVASSGNGGSTDVNYPAGFEETLSVGATVQGGQLAGFSNYGATLDLVAPGQAIYATQRDNSYGENTGTSFSAPIVAAALGLIWSRDPSAAPETVTGTLLAGCSDRGFSGWDPFFGHGIVDLEASLGIGTAGHAAIAVPEGDGGLAGETAAVIGSAFGPAMTGYRLSWGPGETPFTMTPIADVSGRQILNDTLGVWDFRTLPDGPYVLELRLLQRGLPDRINRVRVRIDRTAPRMSDLTIVPLYIGPERGVLIRFASDDPTQATLWVRQGGGGAVERGESRYFQTDHAFRLDQNDLSGPFEFYIELRNAAGLTAIGDDDGAPFRSRIDPLLLSGDLFEQVEILPDAGYLLPVPSDINGNGSADLVYSALVDGERFGPLTVREREGDAWPIRLQTAFAAIPRDVGRIGPAGGLQLGAGFGANSLILGGNGPGAYPDSVVWADTSNFWLSRIVDLDDDPRPEIVALTFSRWVLYDIDDTYRLTEIQTLPDLTDGNNQFGIPWTVVTDLDRDDRPELFYDDLDGDLYRFERGGDGRFAVVETLRLPGKGGGGLYRAGDMDGNGYPELVTAVRTEPEVLLESNADTRYWTVTVWRDPTGQGLVPVATANIFGVTLQPGIFNGLSLIYPDGSDRASLLFTPYPDAYLFDLDGDSLVLRWHRTGVNANAAVMAPFTRARRPDLVFNTRDGLTRFRRAGGSGEPLAPVQLRAVPLDTGRIALSWNPVPTAQFYRLYRGEANGQVVPLVDVGSAAFIDTTVANGIAYTYRVSQVDSAYTPPESPLSVPATAAPAAPPRLVSAEALNSRQVLLAFDQAMGPSAFEPSRYRLADDGRSPASAIRAAASREALLSFEPPLPAGTATLGIASLTAASGAPLGDDTLWVAIAVPGTVEPFYVESVHLAGKTRLEVRFNRPPETASAADPGNYRLHPDGDVLAARVDSCETRRVILTLDPRNRLGALGVAYEIEVSGVRDPSGQALDPARGNRLAITAAVSDLADAIVYPNPFRADGAAEGPMFANLPPGTEVVIFSASGTRLRRLEAGDSGGVPWDLRSASGDPVASGVYLFLLRYAGQERTGKFMIIR